MTLPARVKGCGITRVYGRLLAGRPSASSVTAPYSPPGQRRQEWDIASMIRAPKIGGHDAGRKPGARRALKPRQVCAFRLWLDPVDPVKTAGLPHPVDRPRSKQANILRLHGCEDTTQAALIQPVHPLQETGEERAVIGQNRIVAVLKELRLVDRHLLAGDSTALDGAAEHPIHAGVPVIRPAIAVLAERAPELGDHHAMANGSPLIAMPVSKQTKPRRGDIA